MDDREERDYFMATCWHLGASLCAGVITSGAVRVLCNLAAAWYSQKTHIYIHSWFHQGDGKVKSGRMGGCITLHISCLLAVAASPFLLSALYPLCAALTALYLGLHPHTQLHPRMIWLDWCSVGRSRASYPDNHRNSRRSCWRITRGY